MELSAIEFFFTFLAISIVIGMIAVLGGVGGGVVFTPLMMGFTPIDSFIIRGTGLLVAMAGSLIAARPFLKRGLDQRHSTHTPHSSAMATAMTVCQSTVYPPQPRAVVNRYAAKAPP